MVLTSVLVASPSTSRTDLADADAAYREGLEARADAAKARPHFLHAAELYEAAWDGGTRSPAVARNMAQARYLAGDIGSCIRDYRRGLKVFPHDPDLRAGLAFARDQVPYPHAGDLADAARPRDLDTSLDRLPVSFMKLAWIAVAVAGVGWLTLARAWVSARGGLALVGGAMVVAAAAGGGWLWWQDGRQRAHWEEPTAVIVSATELRTGNSDEYPRRVDARLPAGAELKFLGERGGWLHVELAGGPVGWVPKDHTTEAP
jgi:tetratricopeptide (TPR) repeat protein